MTDYAKTAAGALKAVARAGRAAVLRQVAAGEYDPATGVSAGATTDHACQVVTFDYSAQSAGMGTEPDSLIQVGDKQIYMAASGLSVTPAPGNIVVVGADSWRIIHVKAVNPAGIPILYELNGRK